VCPFFSAAFYNFFDGLVLVRAGRSRGRAGRAVGCRFSGRQSCRLEIPTQGWEGVVEMSSVVCRCRCFLCRRVQVNAAREGNRLDKQARNHRGEKPEWVGETNRN
jgi:hypothetical protein